jgi:hypothetical protein
MDKYERAALKFANRIRRIQGRELLVALPTGDTGEENSCPIANAINNGLEFSVAVDTVSFSFEPEIPKCVADLVELGEYDGLYDVSVDISLPASVTEFIERFDDEKYPHLIR